MGDDAAFGDADDFGVEEEGFADVVGDAEDGGWAEPGAELVDELVADGGVEAGEGFVEEEDASGGAKGGADDGDALALASGELVGEMISEFADSEVVDCPLYLVRGGVSYEPSNDGQVLSHRLTGKEHGALRSEAHGTPMRRQRDSPLRVEDRGAS